MRSLMVVQGVVHSTVGLVFVLSYTAENNDKAYIDDRHNIVIQYLIQIIIIISLSFYRQQNHCLYNKVRSLHIIPTCV